MISPSSVGNLSTEGVQTLHDLDQSRTKNHSNVFEVEGIYRGREGVKGLHTGGGKVESPSTVVRQAHHKLRASGESRVEGAE